ncbi:hypothetical protein MBM_06571 [Drepanopeziza brunnea f. sp. 'multigermtubi' MB_m1]|uniref:Uncharacterized protein n=1 Tax=Marssonina brunnea f. sp. multigermtubi (strain MB_m1) TaxID=1072389 RepID=K1WD78_MARBU|nr:uncharacterized protein MBM_06571 [Drepanopeziza brunnea f. sp. 'multigermtubi' MB_m1]EKD15355.1 hypothetical protein MBM_06571 [Drepanopeziza brunnea f. sp. 'multigermtubi' MB_m1]
MARPAARERERKREGKRERETKKPMPAPLAPAARATISSGYLPRTMPPLGFETGAGPDLSAEAWTAGLPIVAWMDGRVGGTHAAGTVFRDARV